MANPRTLVIVGSFLAEEKGVYGGVARSCQTLMQSSFADRFNIITVDSTQISNPPPGTFKRFLLAVKRMYVFLTQVIKHKPDALVLFASVGLSFVEKSVMAWLGRALGCHTFIFPRGGKLIDQTTQSPLRYHLARYLFKGAHEFLSQGQSWSDFAIQEMGFVESRVHLIPNWTATKIHLALGAERGFSSNDMPKLLFVGWLEEFKGVFELLRAVKNLHDAGYEMSLTLAGRGNAEEAAKAFIKEHGLEGVITFAGWVEADSLEILLRENNVFVLPSWAEGLPNSMIEAMACGLAVVVSDVGIISDFVEDQKHALLVTKKNAQSLEQALKRVIEDPEVRIRLAKNGYQLAAKQFSVEVVVQKFGDVIDASCYR